MKEKIKIIAVVFTVGAVILCAAFFNYANSPKDRLGRKFVVEIPKGSNFSTTSDTLKKLGLISNKTCFYILALLKEAPRNIRAGEYDFDTSMSPLNILEKLVKGRIKGYRIPIPEGFTVDQIAFHLAAGRLVNEEKFIGLAHDGEFLSSAGVDETSAEGYLFPNTYILTRSMGEEGIMKFMIKQFKKSVTPDMLKRAKGIDFKLNEVVTLASIIEKEGGPKDEKPIISAVFHNRLKKGMKLQSDPTVIYGIEDFNGNITREDLRRKTPYNTYRINGLPPGPICNPGLDSILAALYPAPVDYLYFVSKNDGTHQFSSDLASHNRAVVKYQIRKGK